MKTLKLADTGRLAEELKNGETIELVEDGKTVAQVVPLHGQTAEDHLDQLVREGKAQKGAGTLPEWFFRERPPKFDGSVLEQLLSDRQKNEW